MTKKTEGMDAGTIGTTAKTNDATGKEVLDSKTFMNFAFCDDLVRAAIIDDKEWFVANDICTALGYGNPREALAKHCKGVTKRDTLTQGGRQTMNFINEADLYRLIFSSKLPEANQFADWVYEEVLPSIRKTGQYTATPSNLTEEKIRKIFTETSKKLMKQMENKNRIAMRNASMVTYYQNGTTPFKTYSIDEIIEELHARHPYATINKEGICLGLVKKGWAFRDVTKIYRPTKQAVEDGIAIEMTYGHQHNGFRDTRFFLTNHGWDLYWEQHEENVRKSYYHDEKILDAAALKAQERAQLKEAKKENRK